MNAALLTRSRFRRIVRKPWVQFANFERGALTPYPTGFDSGNGAGAASLAVNGGAALRGNYGFSCGIPDANARFGQLASLANEKLVELKFLFDLNSIVMGDGDAFTLISTGTTGAGGSSLQILLQYAIATGYKLATNIKDDAGGNIFGVAFVIADEPIEVRICWKAADYAGADNGFLRVFINDEVKSNQEGIDNDTHSITTKNFGAISGLDAGTTGTIFFDDIRWRRA
jgi:hypothetical protein